ncbi:ATP-binding protein [Leucothrix mucor]|uniref:ATP-binding protein n=1 Tax=Leucothrix mucor TaxID=45248 RepID=UPI0003B66EC5|nr:ATP-binding protein [Leucothrix mucor]
MAEFQTDIFSSGLVAEIELPPTATLEAEDAEPEVSTEDEAAEVHKDPDTIELFAEEFALLEPAPAEKLKAKPSKAKRKVSTDEKAKPDAVELVLTADGEAESPIAPVKPEPPIGVEVDASELVLEAKPSTELSLELESPAEPELILDLPESESDQAANAPAVDRSFGLQRMILVDSLSTGRIVEMPVDGGSVLTGRNGRGKTSLLQLLMLFYGESPNRIVTAQAGRDSFIGYYLPRSTSYIIFEYQREAGEQRLVVAYADSSGERVFYRFVRHGFELNQFITEDGKIVQAQDLVRHLKLSGYHYSEKQIESLTEYRAIIQAVGSGTRDRQRQKYLRALTADYACTSINHPLGQIEKIVSGMFRRKTNFEDLQSMTVDCVALQDGDLSLSGDRRKIEDWPRHFKSYREVMALAPKMEQAEAADNKLQVVEQSLGEIRAKYQSLANHQDAAIEEKLAAKRELEVTGNGAKDAYDVERTRLIEQRTQAKNDAESAEKKVADLQSQSDAYDRQKIQQQAELVEQAPQLRSERKNLEDRRETLLGKQSEIFNRYERHKQDEKEKFNDIREQVQEQLMAEAGSSEADLVALESQYQQAEQTADEALTPARQKLQEAIEKALQLNARNEQAVSNPMPDASLEALLANKREALDAAHQHKSLQEEKASELSRVYQSAQQAFQEQERLLNHAQSELENAKQKRIEIERFYAPEAGTLLHFLRNERPDWTVDIAKVIRGDILTQKDLSPALLEQTQSIYGVSLELEKLQAHPLADHSAAAKAIEEAEARLDMLKQQLEKAEQNLQQAGVDRKKAESNYQAQRQALQQCDHRIQQVQTEVQAAQRQVAESRALAKQHAEAAVVESKQQLSTGRQRLAAFEQQAKNERQTRQNQYQQSRKARLAKRDEVQAKLKTQLADAQARQQVAISQLDSERHLALQAEGVDSERVQKLEDERKAINQSLAKIDQITEAVQQWQLWCRNEWPQMDTFRARAEESRKIEQGHQTAVNEADAAWKAQHAIFMQQMSELNKNLEALYEQQRLVRQHLDGMSQYPQLEAPEYDVTWTLDMLTAQANQYSDQASKLNREIHQLVTAMQRGFRVHIDTPPEQFFQSHNNENMQSSRKWIAPLKSWFDEEHFKYQRILLTEAKTIASDISAFHHTMEDFHRKVLQFNRELQTHLDTSLTFESISEVSVEVISTIKELKYWNAICDIAETNRHWLDALSNELPPPEFAQTLERLLEHWEVKSGIRADLKHLIRIQGEVVENGNRRTFRKASDLEGISSNGLSYLILVTIFIAFINRIRRNAPVNIVWALDELKDLDSGNVPQLMALLKRNNITLVSAFPDPDPDTLSLFKNRFTVEPDRRLAEVKIELGEMA